MCASVLYLLGDYSSSKASFFGQLGLPEEQLSTEASIYIYKLTSTRNLEIYDVPADNFSKEACKIYLNILPKAHVALYFINPVCTARTMQFWMELLAEYSPKVKLLFVSSARSYHHRQLTIARISRHFPQTCLSCVFFPQIDPLGLTRLLCNIDNIGLSLQKEESQRGMLLNSLRCIWLTAMMVWRRVIGKRLKAAQSVV